MQESTPTTAGSYTFTVNVIDANNGIATTSITLTIIGTLTLHFTYPPPAGQDAPAYSRHAHRGRRHHPVHLVQSAPGPPAPAGLTLNTSTGVIAGTPAAAGTSSFTIKITDAPGTQTATKATSITITAGLLAITVTSSAATAAPGGTVHYTITATNSGSVAYTGATFTDALSDVLDDASYNNNATATARRLHQPQPDLDREPRGRGHCHHHVLGDREEPRHRKQEPRQHHHLQPPRAATAPAAAPTPGAPIPCRSRSLAIVSTASTGPPTDARCQRRLHDHRDQLGRAPRSAGALTDALSDVLDDASYDNNAAPPPAASPSRART